MSHKCAAPGCRRQVGDQFLMCGSDWRRVPPDLQRRVYQAYNRGKGLGSPELLEAQQAAIKALGDGAA